MIASLPPALHAAPARATVKQIGLFAASRRLGWKIPDGRGVVAGHVEGDRGKYMPNWRAPGFRGVTFLPQDGPSKVFGHTNVTAGIIYGAHGLAPGIKTVYDFDARDWLTKSYLRLGSPLPPLKMGIDVFNHSWIGADNKADAEVLRRVDWLIDTRDVVMCVGVNNHRESVVPALLASAYNVIAVGVPSGNSSGGYTRLETAGRCKPDIVAPGSLTSYSTPVATACAARLIEAAEHLPKDADRARRSAVIKAALLAGATKPKGWKPAPGKPLDNHLGAGLVNINNSLLILQSGAVDPGAIDRAHAWDARSLPVGGTSRYTFTLNHDSGEASIIVTWNRHIAGRTVRNLVTKHLYWLTTPSVAHFQLHLLRTDEQGKEHLVAASDSPIDNVQHIYLPRLPEGHYTVEVIRTDHERAPIQNGAYAIAWRFEQPVGEVRG